MITVKVEGLDEAIAELSKLGSVGEKYLNKGLDEVAALGMSEMRVNAPVVTNRLRSSIHYETPNTTNYSYSDKAGASFNGKFSERPSKLQRLVGTNVHYADDANERAKDADKRHFFEKGVAKMEQVAIERLESNYSKAINETLVR